VLLIQTILGPIAVVAFTVMRTIFSMMRQALSVATNSIGPEVTNLFGRREWPSLARLYTLSENVVFAAIPPLNITALLLAPVLLQVWLHKPGLFSLPTYALMALTSCAISVKDHKVIFQISTNEHRSLANLQFFSYLAMIALGLYAISRFGLPGFLVLWFVTEAVQAAWVLRLNRELLHVSGPVSHAPAIKMAILLPLSLLAACWTEHRLQATQPAAGLVLQTAVATSFGLLLLLVSGWTFHLRPAMRELVSARSSGPAGTS